MSCLLRPKRVNVPRYDKLKPYGFPIHGCIDGFSRKIIWLKIGPTNNDPVVVAFNFAQCVDELKGCPMVLQSDPGTENCVMGSLQYLFRHISHDTFSRIRSYRVVRSIFNQVLHKVLFDASPTVGLRSLNGSME
ncbi:uncharacterized protein LOC110458943 isoform X2 [Mizuhopecten yessoensis]|nr:uncharacterized protein LOC110458943 isoform X2 [Mizuhopecten yessoensis]